MYLFNIFFNQAVADGYIVQRDALIFALAVCAKQKTSVQLKESAYSAVKKICLTSQELFLFIKYLHDLGDKTNTGMFIFVFNFIILVFSSLATKSLTSLT